MALVPLFYLQWHGNGKEAKTNMQISKIQQPPIFAQKLQISIKSDFPNRFFNFLQGCVQEGVYFGAHMVPNDDHFFKVVSGLQMA